MWLLGSTNFREKNIKIHWKKMVDQILNFVHGFPYISMYIYCVRTTRSRHGLLLTSKKID